MLLGSTVALVFFGLFLIWLIGLTILFYRLSRHYQKLTLGVTKKDLRSVLEKVLASLDDQTKKTGQLFKEIDKIQKENFYNFQKFGFIRFNPFAETGGDQSFSLALLDGDGNGIVLSSLHSRDVTRLYAKPVKKNQASGYEFSEEEKRAIKEARRIK